jgi:Ala-tRNA(Pro) deacylase
VTKIPGNSRSGDEKPTYERILLALTRGNARFRFIDHPPEGGTAAASRLRGHPLDQSAKCIVVRLSVTRRASRYLLGVVPGDRRISFGALQEHYGSRAASFAARPTAERLAGAVSGAIPPFSFRSDLQLVVDPALLRHAAIFFNAARLDRSMALSTDDYIRLAWPRLLPITEPESLC